MPNTNQECNVFQRKDGRYCSAFTYGQNQRKYFYGSSEAEVKKKIKEFQKDLLKADHVEPTKPKLGTYILDWLEGGQKLALKPKSYDTKRYIIDCFIIPYLGNCRLGDVQRIDIQKHITALSRSYSRSTVKKVYDVLNQFYKYAIIDRMVTFNPVTGVVLPRKSDSNTKSIRFFTEDELKKILDTAVEVYPTGTPVTRLGYAYQLIAYTGMRAGEAIALTWDDIDFDRKLITINKNSVTVRNRDANADRKYVSLVQNSAKTENSIRTIPMSNKAEFALKKLFDIDGGFRTVLATSTGEPVDHRNLARAFKGIQERAGIKNPGTLHSLRHTFATRLIECGVDIKTISALLGHSDISITYDTYVHVLQKHKVKAIEELDNI